MRMLINAVAGVFAVSSEVAMRFAVRVQAHAPEPVLVIICRRVVCRHTRKSLADRCGSNHS